ncbi:MAG: type II toxin-antitoxin system VapC family toxin [Candidatus Bathyarchaeia archaeon]
MERSKKIVIDASVAIKWYNIEQYTEKALAIREDYLRRKIDLVAPYMLLYEVGNALRYNPDFGLDDVKSAIRDLLAMQIGFRMLDEKAGEDAVDLAYKFGLTFYDVNYVVLSRTENCPLYTADDKLLSRIEGESAIHLKNYTSQ